MILKCLGSGSSGNCYLLSTETETLILDCGLPIREIKKGLEWDISKVVGVLCSHVHSDHAKAVKDFENMGIPVFKPYEIKTNTQNKWLGSFQITTFDLPHNGTENRGFFIRTLENERILYLTDFEYCRYRFTEQKVNHILIECNYQQELVSKDLANYEHKIKGHCSLETCKSFIAANKTNALRTVILCHMGVETTIAEECLSEVQNVAGDGVSVLVAHKGLEVELKESRCPF